MRRQACYRGTELVTRAVAPPPFGPGFQADALADADALELWVSCISSSPFPHFHHAKFPTVRVGNLPRDRSRRRYRSFMSAWVIR